MRGTSRVITEIAPGAGMDPTTQLDSADFPTASPTYESVVTQSHLTLQIASGTVDQAVVLPDCCYFRLISDVRVKWKFAAGETELYVRELVVGGRDSAAEAVPATTALISGNGVDAAEVQIVYLATVVP